MTTSHLIADRFRIEDAERDILGRGGMGEVYRATDTQTGEAVAVKVLNPEILERDPSLLDRFMREGEALRVLNHPNIVHMIAAVEEQGRHYLVMEFVDGGSLRDLLNVRGCLPANEVARIALEVADALTRAHHLGIIHRDLKPANVLLAKDGTPRLSDFGIAHIQDSTQLTQSGVLVGTVDYLSPEVCQGEPPNELSDIWAFGVMLFEMLTGKLPFEGKSLTAKISAIVNQPVPDLAQLAQEAPDASVDLTYRMLEKDPQQRIPSVRQVGLELEALLKGRELVQPPRLRKEGSRFATPTPSSGAPKHNLPAQPTTFVGRQAELTELARLLSNPEVRLLTILGAGGMGKTRLALEAGAVQLDAGRAEDRFADGVYFVALAPLATVEDIVPTIAAALGFSFYEGSEPRQQLLGYLREKSMLLMLDNFEHLLSGVDLLNEILSIAPHVKILATSRVRLNVTGEQLFHLGGMDFPDWETPADAMEYSAVKLFLQSACRVRPEFELSADNLRNVAQICRLVDGMPLGILLAASWLEILSPEEIADEIQKSLDFLATEQRDLPDRQHSIRAVFDYSWNLLTPSEQEVFKKCSVCRGGFTREAAQIVTGASLRDLMGLVDKSLLQRDPGGRYGIHELLRQYAADKLAQTPEEENAARDRHCTFYAEFLRLRYARLVGAEQKQVLPEIIVETDNITTAWNWAVAQRKIKEIDGCLEGLAEVHRIRGWFEKGNEVVGGAVQMLSGRQGADTQLQLVLGRALLWQARFSVSLGWPSKANSFFHASLTIFRELRARREAAYALAYAAGCWEPYGNASPDEMQSVQALTEFRDVGDETGIALALNGVAWAKLHQGNYVLAKEYFHESLELSRKLGNREGIIVSLSALGYVSWILGQCMEAVEFHEEMLALCRETGNQGGIALSIGQLGIDAYGLKDFQKARRLFQESLEHHQATGNRREMADELGDLASASNALGEYSMAAQYAQQSLDAYRDATQGDLSWSWPFRELARAACALGDLPKARRYVYQALRTDLTNKRVPFLLLDLDMVAQLVKELGNCEHALELLTLVLHHPISWQMAKDQAAPLIAELEAKLPTDVAAAAQRRGQSRDLETTIEELLVELQD